MSTAKRKHEGITVRHSRPCRSRRGAACNCKPSYEASVYSVREGKKLRKSFPTLAAAKGWRADATSAVRKGTMKAPSRLTLDEKAVVYLDGIDRGTILSRKDKPYKPSVRRAYRRDLERHVLPDLGAIRLADLRRADGQALVDRLVSSGMSPTRIQGIVMPLRALCRHAIERDEIVVNPTANVRLPAVTGKRDRVAAPAEAEELLTALPDDDRAVWATAIYSGPRRGELRAMRWTAVNLPENVFEISRGWDDVEGPIDPKSEKGKRRVPIPATLRRILIEHKMRTGRDGDDLVFGRTASLPFTPGNLTTRADRAWREAGLRRITLQECRHSYVSLMHAAGFSLEQIGDYVGHSSAYMTDRYRHLLDGHEAETVTRFDAFLDRTGAQTGAQAL